MVVVLVVEEIDLEGREGEGIGTNASICNMALETTAGDLGVALRSPNVSTCVAAVGFRKPRATEC